MDRLERLRVFAKVVERGSFSRAGRDLGLSQPTVSKAIRSLEGSLRAQLLLRSTRRVTVTDAGRRYYERCREVLDRLEEADAEAGEGAALRGTLRLHGPVVLGELWLAPALVDFLALHPGLKGELTCLDSYVDLVAEGADLAVRLGAVTDATLVRRRLGVMERLLVASPAYLAARGTPRRPGDLAAHDAVRFAGLPRGDAFTVTGPGGPVSVTLRPGFVSNNAIALRHALVGGRGVGLVTRWLVEEELADGRLVRVLPGAPPPELEASVVFPSARHLPARARAFADFLEARLSGLPGVRALRPGREPGPSRSARVQGR